jgi:hypothetical protein
MTSLFIAAVIAAPFVFWFVWRRTRLRADRERPADSPALGTPIADRMNIATPETVRSADSPALVEKEGPPGKAAEEKLEEERSSALHVVTLVHTDGVPKSTGSDPQFSQV